MPCERVVQERQGADGIACEHSGDTEQLGSMGRRDTVVDLVRQFETLLKPAFACRAVSLRDHRPSVDPQCPCTIVTRGVVTV